MYYHNKEYTECCLQYAINGTPHYMKIANIKNERLFISFPSVAEEILRWC